MVLKHDVVGFVFGGLGFVTGITIGTIVTTGTAILSFFIALFSLLVMIDKHTSFNIPFIHTDKEGIKNNIKK